MKSLFIGISLVFLFASCTLDSKIQILTNKSAKTVSYTMFHEGGTFQLDPGKTRDHKVPFNSIQRPNLISVSPMPFDVEMKFINSLAYEFIDIPPIALNIANTLPVSVTISTGSVQYMSVASITVLGNQTDTTVQIFTEKPVFVIEDSGGYPAKIESTCNKSENKIYVTIR